MVAVALASGPNERFARRKEKRRLAGRRKGPPRWRRALDKGSPRVSFAIGAALSLPGASYLVALDLLNKQDLDKGATIAVVVAFCLVMLAIIELPLLGYAFAPDWTINTVERSKAWIIRDARRIATIGALVVGVLLVLRGTIEVLS